MCPVQVWADVQNPVPGTGRSERERTEARGELMREAVATAIAIGRSASARPVRAAVLGDISDDRVRGRHLGVDPRDDDTVTPKEARGSKDHSSVAQPGKRWKVCALPGSPRIVR